MEDDSLQDVRARRKPFDRVALIVPAFDEALVRPARKDAPVQQQDVARIGRDVEDERRAVRDERPPEANDREGVSAGEVRPVRPNPGRRVNRLERTQVDVAAREALLPEDLPRLKCFRRQNSKTRRKDMCRRCHRLFNPTS